MLVNILIQYALFGVCTIISVYQLSSTHLSDITVEGHVYHCSVTLLLATLYILFATAFYHIYRLMMTRRAALNPDLDGMFTIDSDASEHDDSTEAHTTTNTFSKSQQQLPMTNNNTSLSAQHMHTMTPMQTRVSTPAFQSPQTYRRIMEELHVLDPETEFNHGISVAQTHTIAQHVHMQQQHRHHQFTQQQQHQPSTQVCEITPAEGGAFGDVVVANPMFATMPRQVAATASPATVEDDNVSQYSEPVSIPPMAMARTMHMVPVSVIAAIENAKHQAIARDTALAPLQGGAGGAGKPLTEKTALKKRDKGMLTPEGLIEDVDFCLSVYGYGIVIFVVYYAVDMTILTPALSMLCGLMTISMRDVLTMWQVANNSAQEDTRLLAKSISVVCFILQLLTITELFIATGHLPNSDLLTSSPSYIALTFIFPSVACGLLVLLPRECSQARHIKRAFPTTVLIAIFMVIWARSVDMMLTEHGRTTADAFDSYTSQMNQYFSDSQSYTTNPATSTTDDDSNMSSLGGAVTDPSSGVSNPSSSFQNLAEEESAVIKRLAQPITRELPVLSILLEPLFKLALTFSVITGTVNHKTVEISACICFIVALKQLMLPWDMDQTQTLNYEHIVRAATMSACSMVFCILRYVSCLSRWIRSH